MNDKQKFLNWAQLAEKELEETKNKLAAVTAERDALREDKARLDKLEGVVPNPLEMKQWVIQTSGPESDAGLVRCFKRGYKTARAAIDAAKGGGA